MLLGALTVGASALSIGSGAEVLAEEVKLIKTGLFGKPLKFSDTDFKTALCTADFKRVTITQLPEGSEGTLMLGDRKLAEGQTVRRRNLASLCFIPASASVTESGFKFTVDELCGGAELECIIKFVEKVNYAPKIDTDANTAVTVTTQKGISVYGDMSAEDPEGDDIDYIIVSYPKYGLITLPENDGEFIYTPSEDYEGRDSFTYVARDEYGNYSKPHKVPIRVTARMSPVVYIDTVGNREENAAIAMTALGIMSGTQVGDDMYFNPEGTVTRAEFVAMAMKACGMKANTNLKATFFDDNDLIPASLVSYVATAQKKGIVNGAFDGEGLKFRPNEAITKYEASIIMSALMGGAGDEVSVSFENMYSIPVWARDEVGAMYRLGIFQADESISAEATITRIDAAGYLYRLIEKI